MKVSHLQLFVGVVNISFSPSFNLGLEGYEYPANRFIGFLWTSIVCVTPLKTVETVTQSFMQH